MHPPISQSDIIFSSQATDFSRTLSSLKRSTLSIHNRLKSIRDDANFVKTVSNAYNLPLLANERCGSWYIHPNAKAGSCYFKSTDGHTGEWAFSLRRLNVQVFNLVQQHGGVIIVDSTRRGKSMPDALMKTVPIWCAVFNGLLFPGDEDAGRLYTPPKSVSTSEHDQIEQRLEGFGKELTKLKLDVADLRTKVTKPLRPIWVTRDLELPAEPPIFEAFHPIVLCTASRRVKGAEISEGGYIQGAGDDAEGWSQGLTPSIFWEHSDDLMEAGEDELPDLIASYLEDAKSGSNDDIVQLKAAPWLSIGSFSSLSTVLSTPFDVIITVGQRTALPAMHVRPKAYMHLECRDRKLGSRDLRTQLPRLRPFLQNLHPASILVCDETGKDLAPGVALALLCLYADDQGNFRADGAQSSIDKSFIKQRLSWIMTSHPSASPSRTTLQSINDYLLTEHTKTLPSAMEQKLSLNDTPVSKTPAELIFRSLEGQWTLDRDIANKRSDGLAGKVTGTATFAARPPTSDIAQAEYLYREEGIFHAGPGMQMTINRRWIWRLEKSSLEEKARGEPPSMSIHFVKADGETEDYLYNRLPVLQEAEGEEGRRTLVVEAEHPCGRDFYVSKYFFYLKGDALEHWSVRHEVKGPEKDYVSTTEHRRQDSENSSSL